MGNPNIRRLPVGAYVYHITVDDLVRYVGKGRGSRAFSHGGKARSIAERRRRGERVIRRFSSVLRKLVKAVEDGSSLDCYIVTEGMTDDQAYELEAHEIARLRPSGHLWNIMPGGHGSKSAARLHDAKWRAMVAEASKLYWAANPIFRQMHSEKMRRINAALWSDPDMISLQSARTKARTSTPVGRAAQAAQATAMWTPEFRAKRSLETTKQNNRRWAKEGERELAAERTAKRWEGEDSALRIAHGKAMEDHWSDPDFRARHSSAIAAKWADPEHRAKVMEAMSLPTYQEAKSASAKAAWADPEKRARMTAWRQKNV